jgi:hypothetical protein
MIVLNPIIRRITALLAEDTDAGVTYAALEARLALEKVCYDRLRQRHDYISHAQLRKWQPGAVVTTLMQEVDPYLGQTMTLSIGSAVIAGIKPEDDDYTEIGTEVGFNSKLIAKMWQALANLALHARLPKHADDHIPSYGDRAKIRSKVEAVVAELERLAKGNLVTSGVPTGGDMTFDCTCGEKNRRRASLLHKGKHVLCINPDCKETWRVEKVEANEFGFERLTHTVNCERCKVENHIPWRLFYDMRYDQYAGFLCSACQHKNYVQWRLTQVTPKKPPSGN